MFQTNKKTATGQQKDEHNSEAEFMSVTILLTSSDKSCHLNLAYHFASTYRILEDQNTDTKCRRKIMDR